MSHRRLGFLLVLAACVPTAPLDSRPPPAPAAAPPAATPHVDAYASAPCPADVSLSLARSIDGRDPKDTLPGPYAAEHGKPVQRDQLITRDDALAKVLAVEAKSPAVVPASFRDELAAHGRDPDFRLHMARCELASPSTLRRAGYDAALAFLLGASAAEVLPVEKASIYPGFGEKIEGHTKSGKKTSIDRSEINEQPCERDSQCYQASCDAVTRKCMSKAAKVASFLSPAELDIEDALSRAFAAMLPPQQQPSTPDDDLIRTIAHGRYVRCTHGPLCRFTYALRDDGKQELEIWDRRFHGHSYEIKLTKAQQQSANCYQKTQHTSLQSCREACEAPDYKFHNDEASCLMRCTVYCQ